VPRAKGQERADVNVDHVVAGLVVLISVDGNAPSPAVPAEEIDRLFGSGRGNARLDRRCGDFH
jgi:hypothetical protein